MADKKDLVVERPSQKSLWKRIGIHKEKTNSQTEAKVRSERSNTPPDRRNSNYSQVRNSQTQDVPHEIPEGPDSYEVENGHNQHLANYDPAFRDMLEILKMNTQNEGELRGQLNTLGSEEFCQNDKLISGEKTPKTKKMLAEENMMRQLGELRHFVQSFRENFRKQSQQYAKLFKQFFNLCQPPQASPMPQSNLDHSVCQSVQLESFEVVKDLSDDGEKKGNGNDRVTDDFRVILSEVSKELDQKKRAIELLELKCTEIDARHKMTILRMENENKLLSLELSEVMKRFETERKTLRSNNEDKQTNQHKSDYEQLKQSLKVKEAEVSSLRCQLNKHYQTIQALIKNMYQLQQSNKDSNPPSMIYQKDQQIDKLLAKQTQLQSQITKLQVQCQKAKNQSYTIYEQNFCLLQKIQSFEAELEDKLRDLKKELTKEYKAKMNALQMQNKKLLNQIIELNEKLNSNCEYHSIKKQSPDAQDRIQRTRYNTYEQDARSRESEGSLEMSAPNDNGRLVDRQGQTTRGPGRVLYQPRGIYNNGFTQDDDIGIPVSPPNDRPIYTRQMPPSYFKGDSRDKQKAMIPSDRFYPTLPCDFSRRAQEQGDSSYYRNQNPRHSEAVMSSPRTQFVPDYSKKQRSLFDTMKVAFNSNYVDSDVKRRDVQNHFDSRMDTRSRHGSKDAKIAEFTNLQLQLNKLTKELRSQIAQIPSRKMK